MILRGALGYNTNIDDLEEGEYYVVGHLSIDVNPFIFDANDDGYYISFNMKDLEVKTRVNEYNEARYHLLEVAKRMRNYAAYFTKTRLPMSFYMSGKRKDMGFPLAPMVFHESGTGMPMSDGGFNEVSLFTSGFGPKNGLKPPHEALQSEDALKEWSGDIQNKLFTTQKALDLIDDGSRIDMAVCALGKVFWVNEAEDRLHNCWIALESIAKIDYPNAWIKVSHVLESINKRLDTDLTKRQLRFYQKYRHKSVHEVPVPEDAYYLHKTSGDLYRLASQTLEAKLREHNIIEKI